MYVDKNYVKLGTAILDQPDLCRVSLLTVPLTGHLTITLLYNK